MVHLGSSRVVLGVGQADPYDRSPPHHGQVEGAIGDEREFSLFSEGAF